MKQSIPLTEASPFDAAWRQRVEKNLDDAGRKLVSDAAQWGEEGLSGRYADTGEPLAVHAAGVAAILAEIGADAQARAAAILTMLPAGEGSQAQADIERVRKLFGPSVVTLLQGARSLLRLGYFAGTAAPEQGPHGQDQKEMRRKMLLAMAADLRIVVMRLASRLQSLRWHAASKTPYPVELARETMELYTPLANRLGIWQLKWEMEDLAFRFTQPDTYRSIAKQLEAKRVEREELIETAVKRLQQVLAEAGIEAKVYGRPKHIYSIWNKMRMKRLEFHELFDLRALRVIVADERSCYGTLALVHSIWVPVADEFDDYISRPKPNGYRSLHTVVLDEEGRAFEIQIRTEEMHRFAEYGMAAHWLYKEAGTKGGQAAATSGYDQKLGWMRQLLAWDGEPPEGQSEPSQAAPDDGRIYVMTPQARVIELPVGATPVDFAYHLHTDLGHRCRGAKVDGQMVPLSTPLQTGQIVEIITTKSGGPSRDWLNTQLGFLASPRARSKVRAWFNAIELQQRIGQGQALVEKELQRLGRTAVSMEQLAQQLGFSRTDDLYVAVAKEEFSLRQIDYLLSGQKERDEQQEQEDAGRIQLQGARSASASNKSGVLVVGVDALLTQLARCCRPAPPDSIGGFVTRGRGVSIHRSDCPSYAALVQRQPERIIEVEWGDTGDALYPVDISIHAQERPNLLRDLSEVFAKLRLNVVSVNTQSRRSLAHMVFTIEVQSGAQISRILTALNELTGVEAVRI
ncbi:bifunctional (p)ppGpp synthetase/guanosine-3',5'-bis(diphosphate) 3'-pyrophosphohydrolase [Achromobacter sp. F4_2707]|uniref:RelA/SpoT family protein n=1 Tax=Achromobacter sp. F4_2707 TaxID=3114286 RepID=UPI0039C663DD